MTEVNQTALALVLDRWRMKRGLLTKRQNDAEVETRETIEEKVIRLQEEGEEFYRIAEIAGVSLSEAHIILKRANVYFSKPAK